MQHAIDIMDRDPVTVSPDLPVADLARMLLEQKLDGVCVVEDNRMVGVVTSMDLIFQERKVHLPTFVAIMDAIIPLGGKRAEEELAKVTGTTVRDIMSPNVRTVSYDTAIEDIASLMVDGHVTIVPVIQDGALAGVITKPDILRAMLGRASD